MVVAPETDGGGQGYPGEGVEQQNRAAAEKHDGGGQRVHREALPFERREEARADLQADGENEEYESKLARELEHCVVHLQSEVGADQAREQHARDAEADAQHAHVPQRESSCDHGRKHKYGVCDGVALEKIDQPAQGLA